MEYIHLRMHIVKACSTYIVGPSLIYLTLVVHHLSGQANITTDFVGSQHLFYVDENAGSVYTSVISPRGCVVHLLLDV